MFWVDERVVPKDHADSNYKLASDEFLSKVITCPVKFRICFYFERWELGVSVDLLLCRLFLRGEWKCGNFVQIIYCFSCFVGLYH